MLLEQIALMTFMINLSSKINSVFFNCVKTFGKNHSNLNFLMLKVINRLNHALFFQFSAHLPLKSSQYSKSYLLLHPLLRPLTFPHHYPTWYCGERCGRIKTPEVREPCASYISGCLRSPRATSGVSSGGRECLR